MSSKTAPATSTGAATDGADHAPPAEAAAAAGAAADGVNSTTSAVMTRPLGPVPVRDKEDDRSGRREMQQNSGQGEGKAVRRKGVRIVVCAELM